MVARVHTRVSVPHTREATVSVTHCRRETSTWLTIAGGPRAAQRPACSGGGDRRLSEPYAGERAPTRRLTLTAAAALAPATWHPSPPPHPRELARCGGAAVTVKGATALPLGRSSRAEGALALALALVAAGVLGRCGRCGRA